jgi:hypothetical protein
MFRLPRAFYCKVAAEEFSSFVMCQLLASMKPHFIYTLDLNRDILEDARFALEDARFARCGPETMKKEEIRTRVA